MDASLGRSHYGTIKQISVVPMGRGALYVLLAVENALRGAFGVRVNVVPPAPEPAYAYDPDRKQYYATAILAMLRGLKGEETAGAVQEHELSLGVCDVDLFASGLNFAFGEADAEWGVGVISLWRLRPQFYGQPRNENLLLERAGKEAVHEMGHTLGLGHCPDRSCVMYFSESIADTDVKGPAFCGRCRRQLGEE